MVDGTHKEVYEVGVYLQFQGAAGGVTGSLHRIHVNDVDILLDCGLFQGHRAESDRINRELPDWAPKAKALVLSHAHIDHCGNIPTLVKRGYSGNVYCTPPTRDLCSVMLRDSGMIQEQDARYLNRRYQREGSDKRVEPLYTADDAQAAIEQFVSIPLHRPMHIAPGVTMTFHNSGHVLGSALVQLDLEEKGKKRRLLFTGDLGREELPLLQSPEIVEGVDFLLSESTYGDRLHPDISTMDDQLGKIIHETLDRGGRVYVPSFALERSQEVLFSLERLNEAGKLPRVPIYIDSPLAIAITEIYKLHPGGLAKDVRDRILSRNDPFSPPGMRYISEVEDSKGLQRSKEPCVIIAGSGMCEGGRIVHHFTEALANPANSVVIVGFMAQHTLGRRLIEKRKKVKVLGVARDLHASVHSIGGLSAHADKDDLVAFARATAAAGNVRRIALVHGEDEAREALATALRESLGVEVIDGVKGERVEL